MNKLFLNCIGIAFVSFFATGCMTQAAIFPDPPALGVAASGAPVLGLAAVQDTREDKKAGRISALNVSAGKDMLGYLEGAIGKSLVAAGYNVVQAPDPSALSGSELNEVFSSKIVLPILRDVNISSADALLDPADATFDVILKVYSGGEVVYSNSYHGEHKELLGFTSSGKKPGKVMALAADDIVSNMMEDEKLLNALA